MRALILSISAGGGHKNAAEALEEYIKIKDPNSEVLTIDAIRYISPFLDSLIVGTYLNSLKIYPNAFKMLFHGTDNVMPNDSFYNFVGKLNEFVTNKLMPAIEEFKPDIMVGTHPFTAFMLQILRKKFESDTPNLVIITDYGSHSFWVHPDIDYYVVAHEGMIPELTIRGREWDSVLPLGIPVKPSFLGTFDRKETLKRIGLNPDKKTVTIMGGALAIGNIKTILKQIEKIPLDFQIALVAANNTKLYEDALEISLTSSKDISVLKYCTFMNALMQATDLLVTKPGGLTVTEALISGCPMAIFFAIPGQEVQNAQFLMRNGLAVDLGDGTECSSVVESILRDDEKLKEMGRKSREFSKPYSTMHIYDRMVQSIKEHEENKDKKPVITKDVVEEEGIFSKIFNSKSDERIFERIRNILSEKYKNYDDETYYELTPEEIDSIHDEVNNESTDEANQKKKK